MFTYDYEVLDANLETRKITRNIISNNIILIKREDSTQYEKLDCISYALILCRFDIMYNLLVSDL